MKNPFMQSIAKPLLSGASNMCGLAQGQVFDVTKIAQPAGSATNPFADKQGALKEMFTEGIKLLIMAWLIEIGLSAIEGSIASMVGSSAAGMAMRGGSLETKISRSYQAAQQRMSNVLGDKSGTDFIQEVPGAAKAWGKEFLGGVMR